MVEEKKVAEVKKSVPKKAAHQISRAARLVRAKQRRDAKKRIIAANDGKKIIRIKDGKKERTGVELRKKRPVRRHILSGKFQPPHTIRVNKQVFFGNVPKTATEKDVMEALKRFRRYITSVRILRSTGTGKKVQMDENGKKIFPSRGVAFIRLRTKTARENLLSLKNLKIGGNTIRMSKASVKKSHIKMLALHKTRKSELKVKEKKDKDVVKEKMQENMIKNQKHLKNLKKKLRKKKSTKTGVKSMQGERLTPAQLKNKNMLKKKTRTSRNERTKLHGFKARKAMPRMSRK